MPCRQNLSVEFIKRSIKEREGRERHTHRDKGGEIGKREREGEIQREGKRKRKMESCHLREMAEKKRAAVGRACLLNEPGIVCFASMHDAWCSM